LSCHGSMFGRRKMTSRESRSPALLILVVVALATVAFIIVNSLQSSEGSWSESNVVAALFEPVLRCIYAVVGKAMSWMGLPALSYGVFVRKLAHFCEYFLLGVECATLTAVLVGRAISPYVWTDLFIVLAVGVIDEFVQFTSGRTSLITDVMLDFSGAALGIAVALAVAAIVFRRRRRGKHSRAARR